MIRRKSFGKRARQVLAGLSLALLHGWALLALYFWFSAHPILAVGVVAGYLLLLAGIFKVARTRAQGAWTGLVVFLAVVVWWSGRRAEPGLSYPKEVEQDARLELDGNQLIVSGIRNFSYRSLTDFEPRWSGRSYNLDELLGVDLFFNYWGVPDVAHVITSFQFKSQPPLAVSIELRPEIGEPNTLLRGFFKQYELHYVWAEERDVILVRTNFRREQVLLHRTRLQPAQARRLLLDMAQRSNALAEKPEFYNTLTDNCTNVIATHVDRISGRKVRWWQRPLLTGKYERMGYDEGWILHTLPWEQHEAAASIDDRARAAAEAPDFSQRIRTHLPAAAPVEQYPAQ